MADPARPAPDDRTLDSMRLLELVQRLASDALGGRYTLHPDIERAADVITRRYRDSGVAPASRDGYRRDFEIVVGVEPGPGTRVDLGAGEPIAFDPAALVPRPEGTAGAVTGPLVFVGYGIVRPPGAPAFDELAGVSLAGAVAVVLEGAPRLPPSVAEPRPVFGVGARDLGRKLERLAAAGAAAVIVIDDPAALEPGVDRAPPALPSLRTDRPLRRRVGIPVLQLHPAAARTQLRLRGRTLGAWQRAIDRGGHPRSAPWSRPPARVVVDARPRVVRAPNILAMVPGTDLAHEIVLVGAHYDHLGTDADGHGRCRGAPSPRGGIDVICNGADDNASGSAIVAELALSMTAGPAPSRTVVFAHFAGEELGLLGSRDLAARLDTLAPFAERTVVAMLNVDMVGRLRERLTISGVGSSEGWMPLLDEVGPRGMRVLYDRALTRRSDHAPFYERGIPSLFFFTELHADYHAPGDEVTGLRPRGLLQIAELVAEITRRVADGHPLPFSPPTSAAEGLVRTLPGDDPATIEKIVGPRDRAASRRARSKSRGR